MLFKAYRIFRVEASYHQVSLAWNNALRLWTPQSVGTFARTVVGICELPLCHTFVRLLRQTIPEPNGEIVPQLATCPMALALYRVMEVCESYEGDLFYYFNDHVRADFEAAALKAGIRSPITPKDIEGVVPGRKLTHDQVRELGGFSI